MLSLKEKIIEKLDACSESELTQLLESLDLIISTIKENALVDDPLWDVVGILSGEPVSSEDIDEQLYLVKDHTRAL